MTEFANEELCLRIRSGETELMPQLWHQVQPYIKMRAKRIAQKMPRKVWADIDDFEQAGYFALLKAVEGWDPDTKRSFISYLTLHLKNAFAECGGWRTIKGQEELNSCPLSLDEPIYKDAEGNEITLIDITPCPCPELENVEKRIYNDECRKAIDRALDAIPINCADVIRAFYLNGKAIKECAAECEVSTKLMQQRKQQGLRELRKNAELAKFYYADEDIAAAGMKGSGLGAYTHSWTSATERTAIAMAMGKPIVRGYYRNR